MATRKSRTLMASGANEPVWDGCGDGHSVFARALLAALGDIGRDSFTAEELFHYGIKEVVVGQSRQSPQYMVLRTSGHKGGDFVFARGGGGRVAVDKP